MNPKITKRVKLYSRRSLNRIMPISQQCLYCLKVTTSYKVDSKSLILKESDSSESQREVLASDTYSVSWVVFLVEGFVPRGRAERMRRKGRLLRVSGMFVARCQCCNPAMTDNVTARFCLRGSPYKETDGRKAGNIKAIIERRGRGKCWRGGKATATEWLPQQTAYVFFPFLPCDESMTKWQETWNCELGVSCLLFFLSAAQNSCLNWDSKSG